MKTLASLKQTLIPCAILRVRGAQVAWRSPIDPLSAIMAGLMQLAAHSGYQITPGALPCFALANIRPARRLGQRFAATVTGAR